MTVTALRLFASPAYRQCAAPGCPVNVPGDRDLCHFHSRPPTPQRVPQHAPINRHEHVRNHLREQDRDVLDQLLYAISLDEVASNLGPGWTRRMVERSSEHIRSDLGLGGRVGASPALDRIALVRIVAGFDPCYCGV